MAEVEHIVQRVFERLRRSDMDFIESVTVTGRRQYVLAVIHHAGRRVRILGAWPASAANSRRRIASRSA